LDQRHLGPHPDLYSLDFSSLSWVDSKATVTPFFQSDCRLLTQVQLQRPVQSVREDTYQLRGGRGQRVSELP
jgi:hypothetical protein